MSLDVRESRLSNGLRIVTSSQPGVEGVTLGVWVGVGGRYEAKRISGVSHFIEHLLFKGTSKLSAKEISQAIEGHGGYFNAFTAEENTCYYAHVSYDQMPRALDILTDMYLNPRFDKDDIKRERSVIIEEIMMYRDQPNQVVQEMLGELLWKDHSLGRPLIGTPDIIGRITRPEILDFKKKKYVPANTMLVFAGRVEHEDCVKRVRKLLGRVKKGRAPVVRKITSKVGQGRIAWQQKDVEQMQLALGVRCFGYRSRKRHALKLLTVILGGNMSSRLFQVVREKHGLAYAVHAGAHLLADTGVLVVSAGIDHKRKKKAIDLIIREIVRLKERPVGRSELRRAKDYVIGRLRLGLEGTMQQMLWVGENMMAHDNFVTPEEIINAMESVSAEDIHCLANSLLMERRISVASIAPGLNSEYGRWLRTVLGRFK